jgi:tricorn protease
MLSQPYLSAWKDRDALLFTTPGSAVFGPKVMLIDEKAGSGGDYMPWAFRFMGIGRLIGTRTWGGLIGTGGIPLIDGGFAMIPYFRYFDSDMRWAIENEGVAPDIEVLLDPTEMIAGRDPQLERAIEEILIELEGFEPIRPAQAPEFPTELGK